MKLKWIAVLFSFTATCALAAPSLYPFSKRYKIPKGDDVLTQINDVSAAEQLYPMEIDVVVWNIYKGDMKAWSHEFSKMAQDKEILILQEAYLNEKMIDKFESMPWFEFQVASAWIDRKDKNTASGVVTASTVKSLENLWQRSYYREPIIRTPKMTLFTRYGLAGVEQDLLVGNIHGINFVRAYKLRHMMDQAAKIIAEHDGPVIFGGDFNTWTLNKINNMRAVFKKLGMTEVKFSIDQRMSVLKKKIDYVWVKGLNVLEATAPYNPGADHMPMVLKLSL